MNKQALTFDHIKQAQNFSYSRVENYLSPGRPINRQASAAFDYIERDY